MHILLIARHYPPEISGGARRPSLYVKALIELGHKVTLVTPFKQASEQTYDSITISNSAIDRGRLQQDSLATGTPLPTNFLTPLRNKIRPWRYWPDENRPWADDVIRTLKDYHIDADWIMTTSPCESVHLVGSALSKTTGLPWLVEFRDTWVEMPHRKVIANSKLRASLERRLARKILQNATALTAVSEVVLSEIRNYAPKNTPEIIISHFSDLPPEPYEFETDKLNLVHTGGFTLSDRRRLLAPLLNVLDKISNTRPELVLHIAGPLTQEEKTQISTAMTQVKWHGLVSLPTAKSLQCGADGLLIYTPPDSHALPGKYAEYAAAGRPIFYMGGGDWLDLVETPQVLRPIDDLKYLQKNEPIEIISALTHIDAAKQLISFLEEMTTNNRL